MKLLTVLIVTLFSMSLFASADSCKDDSKYPEVSKAKLQKLIASNSVVLIDVNAPDTFKENHIPGAINYAANEGNFSSVLPKGKEQLIVAYCGGPMCSAWKKAAKKACGLGYKNVQHFKGGIRGWLKGS